MSSSVQHLNKPFASTTPDDHRAAVWVATLLCLSLVVLGVMTRVYVRFKAFGVDDYVMLGAFIVGLAQFCTVIGGLLNGLGEATSELGREKTALAGQVRMPLIRVPSTFKESVECNTETI